MSEFCIATILALFSISAAAEPVEPAWTKAQSAPPMTAAETRQFMSELARFVADNHMKQDSASPQRGMVYEYFHVARKGEFDQFVQGEALDTMHDGAWLAAALATAYRATGEQQYQDLLAKWELPFYLKMLNHSDSLFAMDRNDARPGGVTWGKE